MLCPNLKPEGFDMIFAQCGMRHNFYLPFPWLQWTWRSVRAKSDSSLGFLVKAQARKSNRLAWKWPLETLGKTIFVRAKGPLPVPTLIRLCYYKTNCTSTTCTLIHYVLWMDQPKKTSLIHDGPKAINRLRTLSTFYLTLPNLILSKLELG